MEEVKLCEKLSPLKDNRHGLEGMICAGCGEIYPPGTKFCQTPDCRKTLLEAKSEAREICVGNGEGLPSSKIIMLVEDL